MNKNLSVTFFIAMLIAVPSVLNAAGTLQTTTQRDVETTRIGEKAPEFTLMDSNGKTHSLSDFAGKVTVLEWVNFDCPFVRKHYDTDNMQRLQKMAAEKGVIWLSINSSAPGKQGHFEGETLTKRIAKEKTQAVAYLVDSKGVVGKQYGAKTTPHVFIIDTKGVLVYAGAIDDKPSTQKDTVPNAENYVEKVLDAILNNREPPIKSTVSYGCSVKY